VAVKEEYVEEEDPLMITLNNETEHIVFPKEISKPRKRKELNADKFGQKRLANVRNTKSSDDCCTKLCFFQVPYEKRLSLINKMNRCQTKNEQSVKIASMIQLHTVAQRTTKSASRRSITFGYTIKLSNSETAESASDSNCLDVCKNAFIRLLGISAQNLRYVQQSLKKNGMPPVDRRGKK